MAKIKKPKILLCCGICTTILFFAMLGLGIFTVAFLDGVMLNMAATQVAMTESTYDNWGQIPGGYKANVTRRYTFYNFTNAFDVFYFNDTPVFYELPSQLYAENANLLSPVYGTDGSDVDFNFQFFATPIVASPTDNVTTLNIGPLGFWYSAPTLPDSQIAAYAISALVANLYLDIVTSVNSAAIQFQCAHTLNETITNVFEASGILDPDLQNFIWNDNIHGLKAMETIAQWVHAIANGPDSGSAKILGDYFYLDYTQVSALFSPGNFLNKCVTALNETIKNGYNCTTSPCDPNYFIAVQWATQNITNEPAAHIMEAAVSVTFYNDTVDGYPEISYYLNESFLNKPNINRSEYADLKWSVEDATRLLYFSPDPDVWATNPDTLLHMGNQAFLYYYGEAFDALNDTSNLEPLQPIQDRFVLPSLQHAHVLWNYMKDLKNECIIRNYMNGTLPDLLIGEYAAAALYKNMMAVLDNIPFDLTARIILNNITNAQMNCSQLFDASSIQIDAGQAETICAAEYMTPFDLSVVGILYTACNHPNGPEYQEILDTLGKDVLNRTQLTTFCTTNGANTFMSFRVFSETYLKNFYGCGSLYQGATRCSNRELAILQWSNSTISQRVPEMLTGSFTPSMTIADWYPDLVPQAFEYLPVLKRLERNFGNDTSAIQPIPYDIANQILTFDTLYNEVTIQMVFISFRNQDWDWFEDVLFGVKPYPLVLYFRYVMMELAFGGFGQTRSVGDMLWGYNDTFLTGIKNKSPLDSGDPSLNNLVTLAGPNCTAPDSYQFTASMYTGTNDSSLTRHFISINDLSFINYNHVYFNGNETVSEFISPWAGNITLEGTDGVINTPGLDTSDNVTIYISDLNFQSSLTYSGNTQDYSNLQSYRYILPPQALQNSTNNPNNTMWYSDKWDGLINISLIHRAPLFVSKGHFLDVDPFIQNAVKMYTDSSLTTPITSSDADNLYVDIEPYSGGAVGTSASLQINYEYKQDPLFASLNYAMLPIMLTQRSMGFTDDQVNKNFL